MRDLSPGSERSSRFLDAFHVLRERPAPHWHGAETSTAAVWAWIVAASLPAIVAVTDFGLVALSTLAISIATALLVEGVIGVALSQRVRAERGWESHALLTGLLVALTLPSYPSIQNWQIPFAASLAASLIGRVLGGGQGNYLWHPVAIGRVVVQLLFASVIASGMSSTSDSGLSPSAIDGLVSLSTGNAMFQEVGRSPITVLVRDYLPPWGYTLFGLATKGTGPPLGGCAVAVMIACLFLAWRGHLRLECVVAAMTAAAVTAFVLPVSSGPAGTLLWAPGLTWDEGLPVGLVYVLYHLTSGELPLVILLLAGDAICSPLTSRGQRWFGAGIGVLTIVLRLYGMADIAGYWALLAMNTLVPFIDRYTKRRVMGTA